MGEEQKQLPSHTVRGVMSSGVGRRVLAQQPFLHFLPASLPSSLPPTETLVTHNNFCSTEISSVSCLCAAIVSSSPCLIIRSSGCQPHTVAALLLLVILVKSLIVWGFKDAYFVDTLLFIFN